MYSLQSFFVFLFYTYIDIAREFKTKRQGVSRHRSWLTRHRSWLIGHRSWFIGHRSWFISHRSWFISHRLTGHRQQGVRNGSSLPNDKRLRRAQPFEVLNVGGDYSFQGNSFQFSSEPSTNSSLLLESWMPLPWTLDAVSIMECSENISREVN